MQRFLFADIPPKLVDFINKINWDDIPPQEIQKNLLWLRELGDKHLQKRPLTPRDGKGGKFSVHRTVPEEAFDLLNRYIYPKISAPTMLVYAAFVENYFRSHNIPVRGK